MLGLSGAYDGTGTARHGASIVKEAGLEPSQLMIQHQHLAKIRPIILSRIRSGSVQQECGQDATTIQPQVVARIRPGIRHSILQDFGQDPAKDPTRCGKDPTKDPATACGQTTVQPKSSHSSWPGMRPRTRQRIPGSGHDPAAASTKMRQETGLCECVCDVHA